MDRIIPKGFAEGVLWTFGTGYAGFPDFSVSVVTIYK